MVKAMTYFSISSVLLTEEAEKMWFDIEILSRSKNLFYVRWNWKEQLFKLTDFGWNSSLWFKLCDDKELTNKVLNKNWIPIAKSHYILKDDLVDLMESDLSAFAYPLIIKPIDEWHWNGVIMWIASFEELKLKLKKSFDIYDSMIIQEQISWDEIRVLVVKWEILVAINRIPAFIIWDWKSTIEELIENENSSNDLRWEWYKKPLSNIEIDDELISFIEKKWLKLTVIPANKENVSLRWNSNLWTGWIPMNVTDKISEDIRQISINTAKYLGLEICWVDILTSDITKSLSEAWWIVLEANATPWIWWHKELLWVNSARKILDLIFNEK